MSTDVSEQPTESVLSSELTFTFNKFVIDLVLQLKTSNRDVRNLLKSNFKSISTKASEYLDHACNAVPVEAVVNAVEAVLSRDFDAIMQDDAMMRVCLLKDIPFGLVAKNMAPEDAMYYLAVLTTLVVFAKSSLPADKVSDKTGDFLQLIKRCGDVGLSGESDAVADAIADGFEPCEQAQLRVLLRCVVDNVRSNFAAGNTTGNTSGNNNNTDATAEDSFDKIQHVLENSKIGSLAKEISQEIDPAQLGVTDPSKLLNFADLTNGNSALGSIVGKVGSKIQNKIQSGELRHEDLLQEAVSLLSIMDKGFGGASGSSGQSGNPLQGLAPMMQQFMGAFAGGSSFGGSAAGAAAGESDRSSAMRDKLRAKLTNRKA